MNNKTSHILIPNINQYSYKYITENKRFIPHNIKKYGLE
jgi:hypothetical protein